MPSQFAVVRRWMVADCRSPREPDGGVGKRHSPSSFNATADNSDTRRNALALVTNREHCSRMLLTACGVSDVHRFMAPRIPTACAWAPPAAHPWS